MLIFGFVPLLSTRLHARSIEFLLYLSTSSFYRKRFLSINNGSHLDSRYVVQAITNVKNMKLAKTFLIFSNILCDDRPNVIILIGDDFGAGDFRVNQAASKVPTPNIDRLANEGVNFKVN